MVLFEGAQREDAMPAVGDVANVLDARRPGREEIFGSHVWLDDLRDKIGRDEDTNANLTRRMLFVLESVPVAGDGIYQRARRALVAGYLDANVKDHRPPRFFLNDVIRYWRTIAVDFESKMRARKGEAGACATRSYDSHARHCSPAACFPYWSAIATPPTGSQVLGSERSRTASPRTPRGPCVWRMPRRPDRTVYLGGRCVSSTRARPRASLSARTLDHVKHLHALREPPRQSTCAIARSLPRVPCDA